MRMEFPASTAAEAMSHNFLIAFSSPSGPRLPLSDAAPLSPPAALAVDRVRVAEGDVMFTDLSMRPPLNVKLEKVDLEAVIRADRVELNRFFARVAEGTVSLSGLAEQINTPQSKISFKAEVDSLKPEELITPGNANQPYLRGKLSLSFQGAAQGMGPEALRSISGDGSLRLRDGVLANLNVLREVFSRISIIPGLAEKIQSRLPESYQQKFNERDTALQPVDLKFTARNGVFTCDDLRLATDLFALTGKGIAAPDLSFRSDMRLDIDAGLSDAIVRSVGELEPLLDQRGRMAIPVRVQGQIPRIEVAPDIDYIASRVIAQKAEDIVGNLLNKVLEKNRKE